MYNSNPVVVRVHPMFGRSRARPGRGRCAVILGLWAALFALSCSGQITVPPSWAGEPGATAQTFLFASPLNPTPADEGSNGLGTSEVQILVGPFGSGWQDPVNPFSPSGEDGAWDLGMEGNMTGTVPAATPDTMGHAVEIVVEATYYQDLTGAPTLESPWIGMETEETVPGSPDPVFFGWWMHRRWQGVVWVPPSGQLQLILHPAESGSLVDRLVVYTRSPEVGGGLDWGDAPHPRPTLAVDHGPRHRVDAGIHLGVLAPDAEEDGTPDEWAEADAGDDGLALQAPLEAGQVSSWLIHGGPSGGHLDAWMDLDRNGEFDHPGELLVDHALPVTAGLNTLTGVMIPAGTPPGPLAVRGRLSSAGGLLPTDDPASPPVAGEVEDYVVVLGQAPPAMPVVLTSLDASWSETGQVVRVSWTAPPGTYGQLQSAVPAGGEEVSWQAHGPLQPGDGTWSGRLEAAPFRWFRVEVPWTAP